MPVAQQFILVLGAKPVPGVDGMALQTARSFVPLVVMHSFRKMLIVYQLFI